MRRAVQRIGMRGFRSLMIAIPCAVLIGACGSSGGAATTAAGADPALEFSQCMRAHGVTNFPDPGGNGSISISPGSGLDPSSPVFQSARRTCGKILPDKGAPPTMSASERRAAVKFAECMRAHGVPNFPDPSDTPPPGVTRILALHGMVFAVGSAIDPRSPAFRQAATACGVTLPSTPPSSSQ
jgi:hypothetical protein